MRLQKRVTAAMFMSTVVFAALVSQAMAASMPWETSKTPTTAIHRVPSTAAGDSGTVTVLCGPPCYQ
ncbi:hypothetical protein HG826_01595 [Streptomyces sp. GMY01]|uniref:hypothetical protein n=1 Tax=Streptomyces sp. GMY02 TaxID=1333528 RepID=UPI00146AC88F|nr:hypothetical protein [Streptomyces sp. GMY02]NMO32305.1 hypothetical protein [Streptomyces sp. GMY02]